MDTLKNATKIWKQFAVYFSLKSGRLAFFDFVILIAAATFDWNPCYGRKV